MTSDIYWLKKYSAEVKAQQSLEKECRDGVTFSLRSCHLFQIFFRAAASKSTSKTAGGLCAFAAAELGHQIQTSQRTVAAASLALMKTHNFCPSCDSVQHQWEDRVDDTAKIRGSIPSGPPILKYTPLILARSFGLVFTKWHVLMLPIFLFSGYQIPVSWR